MKHISLWVRQLNAVSPSSSKGLAQAAFVLWSLSLMFPGLVLYYEQTQVRGVAILAWGWLAILEGNFAWLANVFFLLAVRNLGWRNEPATRSTAVALLFALDTFRFNSLVTNEGGSTTPIYGYGWGTIFWLAAMTVSVIAAGTRPLERAPSDAESSPGTGKLLRGVGVAALVTLVGMTLGFFVMDRRGANQAEQAKLSSVVFKRGPVCRLESPVQAIPIELNGPLEVVGDEIASPFSSPGPLLSWGVPTVRTKGFDYSYLEAGTEPITMAKAVHGVSAVRLLATRDWLGKQDGTRYRTMLSSGDDAVISFDQTWEPEPQDARHCPEYRINPGSTEQPRALLMSALRIQGKSISPVARNIENKPEHPTPVLKGRIIARQSYPPDVKSLPNLGCPSHTGFETNSGIHLLGYRPFSLGDGFVFAPNSDLHHAMCFGNAVYLYKEAETLVGRDSYFLLEKRSLLNFKRAWSHFMPIPKSHGFPEGRKMEVLSIIEENGAITIELLDRVEHQGVKVEVALQAN
jgi:hypothetical protein